MDSCLICKSITTINWWWFAAATIISFAIGGVWYSWLFAIMKNKAIMLRTALRYAIEKMPVDLKVMAMKK